MKWTISDVLLATATTLLLPAVSGLFIHEDVKHFECQKGWVGELPKEYVTYMEECYKDKTTSIECRKHCLATKMSIIADGKVWLYQLLVVLRRLFPGIMGKNTVDKMVDVILQCTDYHVKARGPLLPYTCYREKVMWSCINKAAINICQGERKKVRDGKDKNDKMQGPNKKVHHKSKPEEDEGGEL